VEICGKVKSPTFREARKMGHPKLGRRPSGGHPPKLNRFSFLENEKSIKNHPAGFGREVPARRSVFCCWIAPHDMRGGRDFFRDRSRRDHSAREMREYFIPDFSDWKNHDEYQKAFGRLMGDLKAGEKAEGKLGYWPMGQRWEGNTRRKWVGTPANGFCTIYSKLRDTHRFEADL
jgi:hypothetical protein